jgi:pimeloyl-ACP methyl ester carboxylesterase
MPALTEKNRMPGGCAMEAVVFIHGITGSKLAQQQGSNLVEIWPPDTSDLLGYPQSKFDILLDQPLKVTGLIDDAMNGCVQVYAPIEADLKDICSNHIKAEYQAFCYDWRQNVFDSVTAFAALLDTIGSNAAVDSITLICHSQGGQIARLMLESGTYSGAANPWFSKIKRALFICTPHMGAPGALTEFVGLESVDLVSAADVQTGAKTWDSAYQLLPAPNAPGNPVILNNGTPQDFYQAPVAQLLGLDPAKVASVTAKTFATLDFAKRPAGIQYSFIVGKGQDTVEALDVNSTQTPLYFAPITDDLGDGTVPIWSASYTGGTGVPTTLPGDHVGIMNTNAFRSALYSYFGVGTALVALHPTRPTAVISLNKRVYQPGERMSVLIIPDVETSQITATLTIQRLSGPQGQLVPYGPGQNVVYQGAPTKFIKMALAAPIDPGGYRIDLMGDNATHITTERTAARFAVVKR